MCRSIMYAVHFWVMLGGTEEIKTEKRRKIEIFTFDILDCEKD